MIFCKVDKRPDSCCCTADDKPRVPALLNRLWTEVVRVCAVDFKVLRMGPRALAALPVALFNMLVTAPKTELRAVTAPDTALNIGLRSVVGRVVADETAD